MLTMRSLALHAARVLGGFAIAQLLTRKRLRILCYHGFAVGDEHEVAPYMFIRASIFERRMKILQKRSIAIIPLDEAVSRLRAGQISNAETVLTFDDGWASNLTIGLPILQRYNYPACIYLTTEHLSGGTEVFNVVLHYMLHSCRQASISLHDIHPALDGRYELGARCQEAVLTLIRNAAELGPDERHTVMQRLASMLGYSMDELTRDDRFRLLTRAEVKTLFDNGIDIQLHTHSHRLPLDDLSAVTREIEVNRELVHEITRRTPIHFCYPGGLYSAHHPEWLSRLGIVSATTCDTGLNAAGAPLLLLKRYLDHDDGSDIEFEAEVAGFRDLMRNARSALKDLLSRTGIQPSSAEAG